MIKYRKEIDGLRAVSVLPVIFFHANFELFSGGFVGVDIFFVISGYLITSIILGEMKEGTFSLVKFYERRVRRILPALFVVILASLPFAWFWMLPDDLENFGQSLVATIFFGNNVLLWLTSGYFQLANEFKPLVHTWSLGVEEQYYILFPILIMLFWHMGRRGLTVLFFVAAVVSLGVAEWGVTIDSDATFYLLPTRGWELLIGALLAIFLTTEQSGENILPEASQSVRQAASLLGLSLILFALFYFDRKTPSPGIFMLIPTIGAALVITFADQRTIVGRLLGSKILVGVGLISYSAYLWHQPLFAFARLRSLEEPTDLVFLMLAGLTLFLAYLTWRFIEQPFRNHNLIGRQHIFGFAFVSSLIVSSCGFILYSNSGFIHLWDELNTDIQKAGRRLNAAYNEVPQKFLNVKFSDNNRINVLVIGNSFARDFINSGIENNYFSKSEISYSQTPIGSCWKNIAQIDIKLRQLISESDYLIFGSPFISLDCWQKDFEILKKIGAKRIVVIGAKNFGWNMNAVMRLKPEERYKYRAKVLEQVWITNKKISQTLPKKYFVDLLSLISDDEGRVPVFTEDRKIISQDREHLTKDGAMFIGKKIFEHPLLVPLK